MKYFMHITMQQICDWAFGSQRYFHWRNATLQGFEEIRGAGVWKLGWVRIPYGPMLSCNSSFVWIYAWSRVIESNLAKDSMEPFYPIVHSCVPNKLCSVVAYFLVFIHKAQLETWECSWLASRVFSPPHRFNELPLLCEASFLSARNQRTSFLRSARHQRKNQSQLFKIYKETTSRDMLLPESKQSLA